MRMLAAAAHNRSFARRMGIDQDVAREFNDADAKSGRLSHAMKEKRTPITIHRFHRR